MNAQQQLTTLVAIVKESQTIPPTCIESSEYWQAVSAIFDSLHRCLLTGDIPSANGHIFGDTRMAVGYPGMSLNSLLRYKNTPILHVRSSQGAFRFAIMTDTDRPGICWQMVEYNYSGNSVNTWNFLS